jgi:galactokinase
MERLFFAPGRINIIGEHTDYSGGFVLPAALTFGTIIRIRLRDDDRIVLTSDYIHETYESRIPQIQCPKGKLHWYDYIIGMVKHLQDSELSIPGFEMSINSTLPIGAGLSSSASLLIAVGYGLQSMVNECDKWDESKRLNLCKQARYVENHWIGVNCGIMDHYIVGLGKSQHVLFIDCHQETYKHVPFEFGSTTILITNSNVPHRLSSSQYNQRVQEYQTALQVLQKKGAYEGILNSLQPEHFHSIKMLIHNATHRNRLQHIVEENHRVITMLKAISRKEWDLAGALLNESQESLDQLYEVSGDHLNLLTSIAQNHTGVYGSRMTGAGFGGCTISLVERDVEPALKNHIQLEYEKQTGITPSFYSTTIGHGVKEV